MRHGRTAQCRKIYSYLTQSHLAKFDTAANFPFCTIDPNVGRVVVPDQPCRHWPILVHPKNVIPTVIEFVDIAVSLNKGASTGLKALAISFWPTFGK